MYLHRLYLFSKKLKNSLCKWRQKECINTLRRESFRYISHKFWACCKLNNRRREKKITVAIRFNIYALVLLLNPKDDGSKSKRTEKKWATTEPERIKQQQQQHTNYLVANIYWIHSHWVFVCVSFWFIMVLFLFTLERGVLLCLCLTDLNDQGIFSFHFDAHFHSLIKYWRERKKKK